MDSSQLKDLKVAVIGGGYAGACTAKAISLLGADVTLYEQAAQSGEVGAGIGLRPSSMAAFRDWGILDAITAVSSPSSQFDILTPGGEVIMSSPWPETDEYGLTTHLIHRRDFIDALIGVLPPELVKWGHRATSIVDNGENATVTFENGESVTADLVVGADGIHSLVRNTLFGARKPVFAHEHTYRAVVDLDRLGGLVTDDVFRMYINGDAAKIYLLPLRHRGQVSFDLSYPNDDATWSPEITNEQLVSTLDGFDARLVELARTIDIATVNTRAAHDIDPVDDWSTASVTLVGDAAHAMLYHQGQGANSAILDAHELARALVDAPSVKDALSAYQATRKPITDELQRISRSGWDAAAVDDVFPGQRAAAN